MCRWVCLDGSLLNFIRKWMRFRWVHLEAHEGHGRQVGFHLLLSKGDVADIISDYS